VHDGRVIQGCGNQARHCSNSLASVALLQLFHSSDQGQMLAQHNSGLYILHDGLGASTAPWINASVLSRFVEIKLDENYARCPKFNVVATVSKPLLHRLFDNLQTTGMLRRGSRRHQTSPPGAGAPGAGAAPGESL